MEKEMEHEIETGVVNWIIGIDVSQIIDGRGHFWRKHERDDTVTTKRTLTVCPPFLVPQ